jgi:hypothetical protein
LFEFWQGLGWESQLPLSVALSLVDLALVYASGWRVGVKVAMERVKAAAKVKQLERGV